MDHDQQLQLLYLLAILILPVAALISRFQARKAGARAVTVQSGEQTLTGLYWMEQGMVFVSCDAGRRGRPPGPDGPLRTAEQLLIEIYRNPGQIEQHAP